jgi:transposase
MGKSHSADLRQRVVAMVASGQSRRAAARHFGVSNSSAIKLLQRRERTGTIEPARQGRPPGSGKLSAYRDFLVAQVEEKPDIRNHLQVGAVHISASAAARTAKGLIFSPIFFAGSVLMGVKATLIKQSPYLAIPDRCHITRIFYMGDEGGITCRLDIGGPKTSTPYIVSITHLIFARRIALFRQIDAYQRHRIKKIKLQNSRNY